MNRDVELIGAFFDENRSAETCEKLQAWLNERPENVALFVDHMLVHNDIGRYVLAEDLSRYEQGRIEAFRLECAESTEIEFPEQKTSSRSWAKVAAFAALAATLLLAVTLSTWGPWGNSSPTEPSEKIASNTGTTNQAPEIVSSTDDEAEASIVNVVATISDTEDCQWEDASKQLTYGQQLSLGTELNLKSGLLQLSFETGAVVIIEGPSRLAVKENAIDLTLGRLSATVPRVASGFSVETPNSEVVDIGTEFGINVDQASGTEVHVFRGEVMSRPMDDSGKPSGDFVRLTKNSAIAFRPGSKQAEEFEANETAFTRRLRGLETIGLPSEAPVDGKLLLWLAADHGVYQDEEGGVVAWLDTLTNDSNRVADNALQPEKRRRPRLIESAVQSMPAIRFDGKNDCLTTTPMTNGDSQTIAFVAVLDKRSNLKGNLLNYNGPPQVAGVGDRSIALQNKLSILQIRACRIRSSSLPVIDPYVYAGHWKGSELFVGRMEFQSRTAAARHEGPLFGEPFMAVYVYDKENNRSELFINGKSYGRSTAPVSPAITSRKVIARHGHWPDYFHGDIAELIVYDEGLEDDRVRKLADYLSAKYSFVEGE